MTMNTLVHTTSKLGQSPAFWSLLLSLCIAAPVAADVHPDLRVATFTVDVTPPLGHLLYTKPLATIEHPLLAKGIVLAQGDDRYVLSAIDWCVLSNSSRDMFRQKMADAAGTERRRVTIQTVHQHTAPVIDGDGLAVADRVENPPAYFDPQFLVDVTDRVADAVRKSIDRLTPIDRIGTGQAKVDRVASSRRIPAGEGKIIGRMSSTKGRPDLRDLPEGKIDPYLKTITLARGAKPLVRLHYYATHPQSYYRDGRASYDFPGIARQRVEREDDAVQIYFTGCSGDVAAGKYNDRSPEARTALAERMYQGMKDSIASTKLVPVDSIEWRTFPLVLEPRSDAPYTPAGYRAELLDTTLSDAKRIRAARRLAFIERSKQPIEICCLKIGRVHVLHLPGECMVEFQLYAQGLRPDDFVATAAYGDGCPGYVCTRQAFAEGGYEPSASAVGPQSEAVLKAAIRELLDVPSN